MARRSRRSESFLSDSEVSALRNVVIALRQKYGRASIIAHADVDPRDFDNFTTRRGSDENSSFRTTIPNNLFQKRLMNYMFASADVIADLMGERNADLLRDIDIIRAKRGRYAQLVDDDYYFNYLASIDVTQENRCKAICDTLAGDYDLYRLSSNVGKIHRSHMTILRYNPYRKVPFFINRLVHANLSQRTVVGSVYELGSNYFFSGFIMKDEKSTRMEGGYLGSKVMVLKKIRSQNNSDLTLMGFFYTSGSREIYDFGTMRAVRSGRKFNPKDVGELEFDMKNVEESVEKYKLPFYVDDIALRFPKESLKDEMIFSALAFDMKYPRGRKRRRD